MKSSQLVRNYYVLPCCLLLLNLCVELASYKAFLNYANTHGYGGP